MIRRLPWLALLVLTVGLALHNLVMALLWGYCINSKRAIRKRTKLPFRLFAIVAPWFFAACLPPMLRAGPEGYKGLIIEGCLIPVGMLILACRPKRARSKKTRLSWNERTGWALPGGVA